MANWLFQGIQERYDVLGDLKAGRTIEQWSITRHLADIAEGDRAVLWVGGKKSPGIYAVGSVTGEAFKSYVTNSGWRRPEDRGALMSFAPLHFDRLLAEDPIPRDDLRNDPRWSKARIITQPQAGNPFRLTDEEWDAVEERLDG